MRLTVYRLLILAGWLPVLSCSSLRNEVTPVQLSASDSPLAVTCFLSPQDAVLAVKVSRITPVLGGQSQVSVPENVPDAAVRLSQGSQFVELRYDAKKGFYQATARLLPIIAGQTYTLTVRTPSGQQASSHCVIPGPVGLTRTTFDSTSSLQLNHRLTRYFVRAYWKDPANSPNYYQVRGWLRFVSKPKAPSTTPPPAEEVSELQFDVPEDEFIADGRQPGGTISCGPAYVGSLSTEPGQTDGFMNHYTKAKVTIELINSSLPYYQYQQAVAKQVLASGNPFAEPVPVPTNIEGGLGCFGGYNRSTQIVSLK
jgi:hypothetical protein